jgi:hypothetical protein
MQLAPPTMMVPLILGGPPRSGTTLFSALLEGHPDINWFIDEGFLFEHVHDRTPAQIESFVHAASLSTESLIDGLRDRSIMPPTHQTTDFPALKIQWSEERFRAALSERKPASVRELWELLRDAYMAGFGYSPRRYVSMKAADYGRSVFGALDHIPEARGVLIVRDPIASINSLKAYRCKSNRRLLTWPTLAEAVAAMNAMAKYADRYDQSRLIIVRYEDFADDPEPSMRALCDWLGLKFEPVLTQPTMMGVAWTNNSSFTDSPSGVDALPGRRSVLSDEEHAYVKRALKPFQQRFGYERVGERIKQKAR